MHFTIPSIHSLAALSAATAIVPRADYGYWDFTGYVNYPVSRYYREDVTAVYHNSNLAAPINVTCSYRFYPGHGEEDREERSCSDPSFSYDFGGVGQASTTTNVTLKQTIGLWDEQVTVTGTNEFKWDFSGGAGFGGPAAGKIDVDNAVA